MHFTLMLQNSQALMWNVRMMHKVCAGITWARRKKYDSASKLANTEANKLVQVGLARPYVSTFNDFPPCRD